MRKYKLLKNDSIQSLSTTLYRIQATANFGEIRKGEKGGYIESVENLHDNAWVSGNARVYGDVWVHDDARIYGNALIFGNAQVYDRARVYGNARVYDDARIYGNARVSGNAQVYDRARVYGNALIYDDARVYDNARVCGDAWIQGNARVSRTKDYLCIGPIGDDRTITCTKSNKTIIAGCWIGTLCQFKKAIKEKYPDGCDYTYFFGAISKYLKS